MAKNLVILNNDQVIDCNKNIILSTFSSQYLDIARYFDQIYLYGVGSKKHTIGVVFPQTFQINIISKQLHRNKLFLILKTPYYIFKLSKIAVIHKNDYFLIYYPASYLGLISLVVFSIFKRKIFVRVTNDIRQEFRIRKSNSLKTFIYIRLAGILRYFEKKLLHTKLTFFSGHNYLSKKNSLHHEIETLSISELDMHDKPMYHVPKNVYFVGRFDPNKGINLFFKVAKEFQHDILKFNVIGFGTDEQETDVINTSNKLSNVNYYGYVPFGKSLYEHYKKSDIFLFTSLQEYSGKTFLEAMAFGNIVIAFNVGKVSHHIVNGQNGFIVEKGDINKMAEYINLVCKNERLRSNINKSAYEYAKSYTVESMNDYIIENVNKVYGT